MIGVTARPIPRHAPLFRLVAVLLLAAQAVSIALAPSAEAFASRSAPAHVEASGTSLHHSHIPEACAACLALQLIGIALRPHRPELPAAPRSEPLPAASVRSPRAPRPGPNAPRAPPLTRPSIAVAA